MSQYKVVDYSVDNLKQVVSDISGASLSYLSQKLHFIYLDSYFKELGAQSIVIESNYFDRDYLEDYAAYYVRSFNQYKRTCARLHFFACKLDEANMNTYLTGVPNNLQENYVGFIVLKPLPQTVIGRTCLKTYDAAGCRFFNFVRTYKVSLLGIELSVKTIAYQEQDSIVAACASSAIWSAFQATGLLFQHSIPSPVEITKAATKFFPYSNRHFPNKGLSPDQMAHAIRNVGLDPFLIAVKNADILKATVYAYESAGIPVVLGMMLVEFNAAGNPNRNIGKHAVTVTGYRLGDNLTQFAGNDFYLKSSRVEKVYCHDDQVGPFARMELTANNFLSTSWLDKNKQMGNVKASPEIVLIPLYHKIRIPFETILAITNGIDSIIKYVYRAGKLPGGLKMDQIEWDIFLSTNNDFKKEIRTDAVLTDAQKLKIVLTDLPKFIWRVIASVNDEKVELIFDATDIEQGEIFIMLIPYSVGIGKLLKTIASNLSIDLIGAIQIAKVFAVLKDM